MDSALAEVIANAILEAHALGAQQAQEHIAALEAEMTEQCRIIGISGSKEAALLARITKLEERLEIRPDIPYDGIECRDETIRQYADQICDLKIRLSQQVMVMRQALDALEREATLAPIEATEKAMEALDAAIKKDMP
jgi:ABC-type histidine transport system ATPase subunit